MADLCLEEQTTSNNETIDDVGMSDWLELQEKAKLHDNKMKELITSHLEDQQRSVSAETDAGEWGPQKIGPDNNHGYVKRSDMWIADSGASNHTTVSDKGCRNKRNATGSTHGIVGESVLPKCELDIPCVHFDKDGAQLGEVIITNASPLPEGNFNLFSVTRLQKKGWTLTGNADYIKLAK